MVLSIHYNLVINVQTFGDEEIAPESHECSFSTI